MPAANTREQIEEIVLQKIRNKEYDQDTIILESELCNVLNVSRTPVREALIHLCATGLLVKSPRKGYHLRKFDFETKIETYYVISLLDAHAAVLAIPRLTEEDYSKMSEYIDLVDIDIKYKKYDRYNIHQEKFHQVYINQCANKTLARQLRSIKASVPTYLYYSENTEKLFAVLEKVNDEHRKILELLRQKKADEVRDFLINVHWKSFHHDMI